jgi:predicted dinucleotide-binding enzyme
MTRVGIIGAGRLGHALATQFSRAGIDTVVSNSRGPESLATLAEEIGPHLIAGTVEDACRPEIVILALPWRCIAQAVKDIRDWDGRIVVDATNSDDTADAQRIMLGDHISSEVVAELIPGAHLVKAFNTLPPRVLATDPKLAGGRRVIFFSGDHPRAKLEIGRLIDRLGFAGIDLGPLREGGLLQQPPSGPLAGLNLVRLD